MAARLEFYGSFYSLVLLSIIFISLFSPVIASPGKTSADWIERRPSVGCVVISLHTYYVSSLYKDWQSFMDHSIDSPLRKIITSLMLTMIVYIDSNYL